MINRKKFLFFGKKDSYNPYYNDYLTVLKDNALTLPSKTQQIAQNNLVIGLESNGFIAKADFISLFATDAGAESSKIQLYPAGSFTCYTANSLTFTNSVGWSGDGTTGKLYADFNLRADSTNFTLNNNAAVQILNAPETNNAYLFGVYSAADTYGFHRGVGTQSNRNNSSAFLAAGSPPTPLLTGISRNNSANFFVISDTFEYTITAASNNIPNTDMCLLGRDISATGNLTAPVSFFYLGAYLNTTELTTLKSLFNAYLAEIAT